MRLRRLAPWQRGEVFHGGRVLVRPRAIRCSVAPAATAAWFAACAAVVAETLTAAAPRRVALLAIVSLLVAARAHARHTPLFALHLRASNCQKIWYRVHHFHMDEAAARLHVGEAFEGWQGNAENLLKGSQCHAQVGIVD